MTVEIRIEDVGRCGRDRGRWRRFRGRGRGDRLAEVATRVG
jgi:hypothetical protein